MTLLLILSWLWPLLLAPLVLQPRRHWLVGLAPLPALAAALWIPAGTRIELPWLLVGATLGLDTPGRIFLGFTALLWLVAALHAIRALRDSPHAGRFHLFFLLAMAGNLWLIVALDLASFYTGFALMGLASYGLVIHDGRRESLRAGKVYLILTLLGETTLFIALVLIAHQAGSLAPSAAALTALDDLAIGLLILGLAVKAGLMPLHVWLPLAHPAAPVPASAVLSGTMIKAALLGWLRFLPLGALALPHWGLLLVFAGLITAILAPLIGLIQTNPKVVLAYSSVAKMGFMTLALGLLLIEPQLTPIGVLALAFYAGHHALTKGGLFLGVGLRHTSGRQPLILAGLSLLVLVMVGVPLTGGAIAKDGLKPVLEALDWGWLGAGLGLAAVVTVLLMARFLWLMWRTEPHPEPGYRTAGAAWGLLIAVILVLPPAVALGTGAKLGWTTNLSLIAIALALGLPVLLAALQRPGTLDGTLGRIPPGDLLEALRPLPPLLRWSQRWIRCRWLVWRERLLGPRRDWIDRQWRATRAGTLERQMARWLVAGALWVGLLLLLIGLAVSWP
jgi:hydrogenase-4 component B